MTRKIFGAFAIGALAFAFVALPAALPSFDGAAWANGSHGGSSGPGGGGGGGNPGSSGPGASGPGVGDRNGN